MKFGVIMMFPYIERKQICRACIKKYALPIKILGS